MSDNSIVNPDPTRYSHYCELGDHWHIVGASYRCGNDKKIINNLIQDGYDFTIRYQDGEYTIFVSKAEWDAIPTWRSGIAVMPAGNGASLGKAYLNLRNFLKDFVPGQV